VPQGVITDRAQAFVGQVFSALAKKLGVRTLRTTPYKPSTNGQAERVHRPLTAFLRALRLANKLDTWPIAVRVWAFRFNHSPSALGVSAHDIMFRFKLRSWMALEGGVAETDADELLDTLALADRVRERQEANSGRQKAEYDAARRAPIRYRRGQLVLIRNHAKETKFDVPFLGPYKIEDAKELTLTIKKNGKSKTVSVQHAVPYRGNGATLGQDDEARSVSEDEASAPQRESDDQAEDEKEWSVDELLEYRSSDDKYLVKWTGFPVSEATWESTQNISPGAISEYWRRKFGDRGVGCVLAHL